MQKQLSYRQKQTVASSGGWGYHFNLFQLTISRPTSETRALRNNFHFICSLVRPSVRPSTSFLSSLSLSLPFFLFFSIFCQPGRSAQPEYLPRQHFALFLFSSLTFFFYPPFCRRFATTFNHSWTPKSDIPVWPAWPPFRAQPSVRGRESERAEARPETAFGSSKANEEKNWRSGCRRRRLLWLAAK
jgi:hypothetical protein